MVSLYDQLISEISFLNPQLSPKEIADQINILIENEILPAAIVGARLSSLPSPIRVKQEELMAPRYGKFAKKPLQEKVRFIQDLEKLRVEFDGSDLTHEEFFIDLMNNTQTPFGEVRVIESKGKALPDEPDIIQEKLKTSPSLERREKIPKKPPHLISFDSTISEKIAQDPQFEKVIGEVESTIRKNYDRETLRIHLNFSMRTDIDDPYREKTIIRVNLPDNSFDEKMEFWDKIETDIRDVIKKLNVTDPERKKINRNLFTHVEPT